MFLAWLRQGIKPCSPAAMFQAWQVDVLYNLLVGVVSLEKGSVIIQYKLTWTYKNVFEAVNPTNPQPCFKHDLGGESTFPALWQPCFKHDLGGESIPALWQPCFKHDRWMYLSNILTESCQSWKRKCDNSIPITWAYKNVSDAVNPTIP